MSVDFVCRRDCECHRWYETETESETETETFFSNVAMPMRIEFLTIENQNKSEKARQTWARKVVPTNPGNPIQRVAD